MELHTTTVVHARKEEEEEEAEEEVACYVDKMSLRAVVGEDGILHHVTDTTLLHVTRHRLHVRADVTVHVMSQTEEF